jgi:hypothetical protein
LNENHLNIATQNAARSFIEDDFRRRLAGNAFAHNHKRAPYVTEKVLSDGHGLVGLSFS